MIMRITGHHGAGSNAAQTALQTLAGWTNEYPAKAAQHEAFFLAGRPPFHRSLEAAAAELTDVIERDAAARNTFQRSAAQ
jgi:hypothetical protein